MALMGADLRNVCPEAGVSAVRADHDFAVQEAVRKVAGSKKLESKLDYKPVPFTRVLVAT